MRNGAAHLQQLQVKRICLLLVAGIVSDEIKIGIKNSRAGNYNMRLNGHIILLNWNNTSTALLRHIASAYAVSILLMLSQQY